MWHNQEKKSQARLVGFWGMKCLKLWMLEKANPRHCREHVRETHVALAENLMPEKLRKKHVCNKKSDLEE